MIKFSKRKFITIITVFPAVFFIIGFFHFIDNIPRNINDVTTKTDAVIVLTGGKYRIQLGYRLLREGFGKKLFISGVHDGVRMSEIDPRFAKKTKLLQCCVVLGYEARSTKENALEVKDWVEKQNYMSFRLVTTDYHMPRSLVEVRNQLPNHKIIPHPVLKDRRKYERWWQNYQFSFFLFKEYLRYIGSNVRVAIT